MIFRPRCFAHLNVVLDGHGGPDTPPLLVDTVPKSASVTFNSYAEADTWNLTYDARLLPIDPDLIRGCAVAIYMFGADSEDDQREWAVPEHEMILGLCDEAELTLGSDGQVLHMEGRDYTGLLLDQEWDPRKRIPSGRPLDVTVQQIADLAAPPGTRMRFKVEFVSNEVASPPIVGAARRSTKKKGLWVKPGKTYWDVIYELAIAEGFIAFVVGETIVISDPRTQTQQSLALAPRMAYGRNLRSLSVRRRLGKERVPQIELVVHDNRTGRAIKVRYPERHDSPDVGLGTKKDEVQRIVIKSGVRDPDALKRIAKTRYENMARAEANYKFETLHLESLNEVDLFQLDTGTPLYIQFDPFNAEQMRALSAAQRVEHLVALGYSDRLSAFIADYFDRLEQFRQPYYLRTVTYDFSSDSGLVISGEAVNFASEVRELQVAT